MRKALLYFRAILFFLGLVVFTLAIGVISLIVWPLPLNRRYRYVIRWSHWVIAWARWICGLNYQVEGTHHVPKGPVIVISNHQSAWEGIFFQTFFPQQTWVLKKELLRIPFFGWALASVKPIAIDRSKKLSALDQLLKQGKEHLQNGRWVIIFPEGTRSKPGSLRRFSLGGAALAAETGVPVLPVVHNAGEYWPPNQLIKRPGTIRVKIGELIETQGLEPREINRRVREWIETELHALHTQQHMALNLL